MEGRNHQTNGKPAIPTGTAFYSPKQMAVLLGVSTETIRRMVADGRLTPPVYFGQRLPRWSRAVVDAWIKRGCHYPLSTRPRYMRPGQRPPPPGRHASRSGASGCGRYWTTWITRPPNRKWRQ